MSNPYAPYKKPFYYLPAGQQILDAEDNLMLDVRGWGHLTGQRGGLGIDHGKAVEIQDRIGARVAELMNKDES